MAIRVRGLVKRYGNVEAVNGIDIDVAAGEIFALLGPNGAGKSTTVEILEGHRQRTSGDVSVLGFDPGDADRAFRERIGIVLQETAVEKELTVREAIDIYGRMYRNRRPTPELIELVGLEEKTNARIKTLSGGQKRRLELALGIVGDPDLLFLDEPTTGFDPSARRQAWKVIENLTRLGKTVLLTTHYMDEAQHLADRLAVISAGEIVATGTTEELSASVGALSSVSFSLPKGSETDGMPAEAREADGMYVIRSEDPTRSLYELTSWALGRDITLMDLTVQRPTLEDIYLELTGAADAE